MSPIDTELRSKVSKLSSSEKEAKILGAAFDEGRIACVSGISREDCRFPNPVRRNAWERGWLESERKRAGHDSIKDMSESERAERMR